MPQRVVLAVGTGLGLLTAAWTLNRMLWQPDGGWFAYAPNTGVVFDGPDPDVQALREGAIYLVATAVWAFLALWLFRASATEDGDLAE